MKSLNRDFLNAMRHSLDRGRRRGLTFWDAKDRELVYWDTEPKGVHGELMQRLRAQVVDLTIAIHKDDSRDILRQSANVAIMAMMVAKIEDTI